MLIIADNRKIISKKPKASRFGELEFFHFALENRAGVGVGVASDRSTL
jgi:hypothetical protein